MSDRPEVEVKLQTASQDYDCDFCPDIIRDETKYVRAALVEHRGTRKGGLPSALAGSPIEKYHPTCYTILTGERLDG